MSIAATSGEDGGRSARTPTDAWALLEAKGDRSIAVCIPARNEAATVGPIVEAVVTALTERTGGAPLVDDVVVVDDGSDDGTAELAHEAGARVVGSDTSPGERVRPCAPPSSPPTPT